MQVDISDQAMELVRKKGGTIAVDWIPKIG